MKSYQEVLGNKLGNSGGTGFIPEAGAVRRASAAASLP
jgi:hypothetical protein